MFISSEYKQWQKCFEQWLMCCNTCSIKVTLSNENIHLNILVYLWKTRSNPQKIAMPHYSPWVFTAVMKNSTLTEWSFPLKYHTLCHCLKLHMAQISQHFRKSFLKGATASVVPHKKRGELVQIWVRLPLLSLTQVSLHFYKHYS